MSEEVYANHGANPTLYVRAINQSALFLKIDTLAGPAFTGRNAPKLRRMAQYHKVEELHTRLYTLHRNIPRAFPLTAKQGLF